MPETSRKDEIVLRELRDEDGDVVVQLRATRHPHGAVSLSWCRGGRIDEAMFLRKEEARQVGKLAEGTT